MKLKAQCLKVMYSRNLLNEEFRDGLLIYNDIFAVRTRCVRRENGNSISEMQPKRLILRRYREHINKLRRNIMKYSYKTKGTCSTQIDFELNGDIVSNVRFTGGCNGNLQGISSLTDGLTVEQIENKLKGIRCGFKPTSCPDQLAIAVREAYESENK